MSNRPYAKARKWGWNDSDGTHTPGIGIFHGQNVLAHLDYNQARKFADRIHDLCDANGDTETPLPSLIPESE